MKNLKPRPKTCKRIGTRDRWHKRGYSDYETDCLETDCLEKDC